MILLKEITSYLEDLAPISYQESYDNSGLQVGDPEMVINGILITLDVTEEVVKEAVGLGYNLVISHHPVIFGGLKSITGKSAPERVIREAIKQDIAIYSGHTNFDSIRGGVNHYIAERLGLTGTEILAPAVGQLRKLVVFVPADNLDKVRNAIFDAGGGTIGAYDHCSFNLEGKGTFRGSEDSDPYVGVKGEMHQEPEFRVEIILPSHKVKHVVRAMIKAHPYEEVAYDVYPLNNEFEMAGAGMVGDLPGPMDEKMFLNFVKERFDTGTIRHSELPGRAIKRVALCGGSGSFLIRKAIAAGADAFVSGDFKYHQFFEAEGKIVIMDIGHYESEQFTRNLFYDLLIKNFPKFAVRLSEINTNPIKYF